MKCVINLTGVLGLISDHNGKVFFLNLFSPKIQI